MKHRLFLAIDTLFSEIVSLQSNLNGLRLPVIWEKPEKLHLTLNFLGRTPDDQLSQITTLTSQVAKSFSPFTLQPYFLETLYHRHGSSLIYLGLTGDIEELKKLQNSLSQSLSRLSLPSQDRFLPHITIGKFKKDDPIQTKKFLSLVSDYDFTPLSPFTVDRLTLYESLLSRSGSHYQKLAGFALQKGL
ncbi:2'-5' RNA ligase [Candidatus Amesbacteria bacterium RIFCSPHIGHO2_02_FULL_47_9]|uniref:RNA 2',3'-cyclic phosphodiesterase n=1 Tax=Candidatus Amesbacteria bacterium RIFCSPHIGHO2_01_FULL_48_32b TaxID=1797253 RepID=A0A1F4YDX3_9BACT|nr:MAG: 2'-5' RNA ligase [Candidatus Amesbacteria bacterium RIFCSPHIGHO2_01_FULL_48_32b]OGD02798.1 MAG: 2'-5' RNA ligase [Candidatus Amesbacteria bacterium RIFCSPHIGHO2_02_FULL_47_9]OGD08144.1 MAG: 2'-5' RNA ligase [Candidatus Amesbacteria bacterium RIFCSPLOWO2_01_FULL_49_25]